MNLVPDSILHIYVVVDRWPVLLFCWILMLFRQSKLKDVGSNYTDWVRNLRIILIVAQKNYVLDAPLGDKPAPANLDVVNA